MYCVIFKHVYSNSGENVLHTNGTKVYYCKKKKLALTYMKRRFDSLVKKYNKMEGRISSNMFGNDMATLEYRKTNNKDLVPTYDIMEEYHGFSFKIVRMQEILDSKNGPALKVE